MTSVARVCSIEGCDRKHEALGYCKLHYRRFRAGTPLDGTLPPKPKCSVEGCSRDSRALGMCMSHYKSRSYHNRENPSRRCHLPGCDKPHHAKGFCYKHYLRDWSGVRTPEVDNRRYRGRNCLIVGCPNSAGGRTGLCKAHVNWSGKYALSVLQAVQILNSGYGCDICGTLLTRETINVDHDHSCCPGQGTCGDCVRGLLCRGCNRAIGSFGESRENVARALAYLGGE